MAVAVLALASSAVVEDAGAGLDRSTGSRTEITATITIGGPSVTVTLPSAGDTARITFEGAAGQFLGVGVSAVSIGTSSTYTSQLSVLKPDGTLLYRPFGPDIFGTDGAEFDLPALPVAGTYAIVIDPTGTNTGSATVTLSQDQGGAIAIGGASPTLNLARVGENGRLTFQGAAGQFFGVGVSAVSIGSSSTYSGEFSVLKPDGTLLYRSFAPDIFGTNGAEFDLPALPVAGTYTIFVDPRGASTGSATVTLSEDQARAIAIGGAAESVNLARIGENARLTFQGSAGQFLGVGVSAVSIGSSSTYTGELSVLKPDGTLLYRSFGPDIFGTNGAEFDLPTLPSAGTYTIFLDPRGTNTGSATVTLSEDVAGTITIGGAAQTLNLARIGQNGRLTFTGNSAQPIKLTVTAVTLGTVVTVIRRPDGSDLLTSVFGSNGGTSTTTLTATGTHTIFVDPMSTSTGSVTLALTQNGPWQPPSQTWGSCGSGGVQGVRLAKSPTACMEDPVDSLTGAFTTQVSDVSLPAPGIAFEFTRTYTSADPTQGRLGAGWADSYSTALTIEGNGDVLVRAEDGQQVTFKRQQDGSYVGAPGALATLTSSGNGYELVRSDQVKYSFTSQGRLTAIRDRNNKGLTFAYNGSGHLDSVTDAVGRQITLSHAVNGLLTGLALPDGRTVVYGYTSGRLTSVTDPAGKTTSYTYDAGGRLATIVDPNGHTAVRNVYGSDGRVLEQYDALNNKTSFGWDAANQVATATDARGNAWKHDYTNNVLAKQIDALGNTTQFGHDSSLNNTSVAAPNGQTTTMSYDSRGNLLTGTAPASLGNAQKTFVYNARNDVTQVTDPRGKVTSYGYDANGNNTTVTQDGQTVATYAYNASGRLTSSTDGRGKTTTYTYDANGNLTSETDPLGNQTTYGYDPAGRRTSMVEPRGNIQGADPTLYRTTYSYDAAGRLLTETDPLGNVTTNTYDNVGNRTSTTDARNKTTSFTYDAANRVLTETAPDGGVTTYTYDTVGNKLTERDPRNKTTTYAYDANNRLASTTTSLGNKTTYFYDANGNLTKEVEPRGNVQGANPDDYDTLYSYDAAGRLLTETDPLGNATIYSYDAVGNRTSVRDARNNTTSYAYNGLNRLTSVTAPGGAATTYGYDGAGNVLTRTDANNHTTSYQYDDAGRQTSMTRPLNRVWTYAYDAAGNLIQQVDANGNATQIAGDGTTTYIYDGAGRQTAINYSDTTPDVTFGYDAVGNRTQMTDGAGSQTYTYDNVNRLASVTRGADTFSYLYDLAGNVTRRTYPDATVVDYAYDDDSRMASVTNGGNTTSYTYDAAGNLTATTLPAGNGYVEERTYDAAGRLTRVKSVKAGQTLVDFSYTLDAVANPTQVVRAGSAAGTTTYAYDARDRLIEVCFQASCPGGADPFIRWTYDGVGNRLTEARPAGTTSYSYNAADELTQAGSTSYNYDENGNETAAGSRTFAYGVANRLASTSSGGSTTTYSYDGDGNRMTAVTGASTKRYLWDTNHGLSQLALERDGSGSLLRRYLYGTRRISVTGGGTSYYHYDNVGSVANLTSANGTVQWTYTYEPFGTIRSETQDDPAAPQDPMKFAGEQLDATGLYHLRARQYDATAGRFTGLDPRERSSLRPLVSPYVYADDQPTVLIDPSGEGPVSIGSPGLDAAVRVVTPTVYPGDGGGCRVASLRQREACAYRFFVGKALTGAQSAGVVANLWWESGQDLNPAQWEFRCRVRERSWHDSNCGVGIAQWTTKTRKEGLLAFAGSVAVAYDFGIQLSYVWHELTVKKHHLPNPSALRNLKRVTGETVSAARRAASRFMRDFEAPREGFTHENERRGKAAEYFRRFR